MRAMMSKLNIREILSLAFLLTIIFLEAFYGKNDLLDIMYIACGIIGLYIWFYKENYGWLIICVALGISACKGSYADKLVLLITLFIIFIKTIKAGKKNEQALSKTTIFKEAKWYIRVIIISLFIIIICNSYLLISDDKYSMLSLMWAFCPLFLYVCMMIKDFKMVKLALSIMISINAYINYKLFAVSNVWFGLAEIFMIGFIIVTAVMGLEKHSNGV